MLSLGSSVSAIATSCGIKRPPMCEWLFCRSCMIIAPNVYISVKTKSTKVSEKKNLICVANLAAKLTLVLSNNNNNKKEQVGFQTYTAAHHQSDRDALASFLGEVSYYLLHMQSMLLIK